MKPKVKPVRTPTGNADSRGVSQTVFVIIGLGIIFGGLWMLYMDDAPYHPEDQVSRDNVFLASE